MTVSFREASSSEDQRSVSGALLNILLVRDRAVARLDEKTELLCYRAIDALKKLQKEVDR